jgi:hypothetical protein
MPERSTAGLVKTGVGVNEMGGGGVGSFFFAGVSPVTRGAGGIIPGFKGDTNDLAALGGVSARRSDFSTVGGFISSGFWLLAAGESSDGAWALSVS